MKRAIFSKLFFLLALIGIDVVSKAAALHWVPSLRGSMFPFGGIPLFDWPGISLSFNTVVNTGMAWGLFPQFPTLLLVIRISIISLLFVYLFKRPKAGEISLWLIAAGALGNVFDMIWYGCVIDFVHLRFFGWSFPIFNLADSFITIGAILLFLRPKLSGKLQEE